MKSEVPVSARETTAEVLLVRMAREVRHALHHMLGGLEVVREEPLTEWQTETIEKCREDAHELLRLVNDLSELAESAGREEPSALRLQEFFDEFCALLWTRASRKGLDLRWSIAADVPREVQLARQALEVVLYRLADNSIRFTQRDEIELSVRWKPQEAGTGKIVIEVRDTGPGIAPEILRNLGGSAALPASGGLGLQLVRKKLAAAGGSLELVSSSPSGTTLAVAFDATILTNEKAGVPIPREDARKSALRLLVAEDSDESFDLFEDFVKEDGHELVRATNGAEAVELYKLGGYDMVVMDVNMPFMDGYTATRAIREWETQSGRNHLPILVLSAESASRQRQLGSAAGCSGYLVKPCDRDEVLSELRRFTESREPS